MKFLADTSLYTDTAACLAWAAGLSPAPPPTLRHPCHLWWRGRFGTKQAGAVRSFLATQDPARTELWLWLDAEAADADSQHLRPLLDHLRLCSYDADDLAQGTVVDGRTDLLAPGDVVQRSNLARYLILARHGGLWADVDTLFLRDLGALLDEPSFGDFTYRWSGTQPYANAAILRARPGSPAIAAVLAVTAAAGTGRGPVALRFDAHPRTDLLVLPSACFDPLWAHVDGDDRYADAPFHRWGELFTSPASGSFFPGAFSYHWHNHWDEPELPGTWWSRLRASHDRELAERLGIEPGR